MQVSTRVVGNGQPLVYMLPVDAFAAMVSKTTPSNQPVQRGPRRVRASEAPKPMSRAETRAAQKAALDDLIARHELAYATLGRGRRHTSDFMSLAEAEKILGQQRRREANVKQKPWHLDWDEESWFEYEPGDELRTFSCERTGTAASQEQREARERRNTTTRSLYCGIVKVINHDSHGCHGRKPRYKDTPRGDDLASSGHFRVKHTRYALTGELVTF